MKRTRAMMGPQYVEPVWLWTDRIDGASNGSSAKTEEGKRVMQPVELKNKVALIVGGASEKSDPLAVSFAERGMDVAIVYYADRGREERARTIKQRVEDLGRRCVLIEGSASESGDDEVFAHWAVKQILETLGRLDVFINMSKRQFPLKAVRNDGSQADTTDATNYFPDFRIMKAAMDEIVG